MIDTDSAEHHHHMMETLVQAHEAREAYELRRDRIMAVTVAVFIGALLVLGAALAGSQ